MNTGHDFEIEVMNALERALKDKELPFFTQSCKLFRHRGYYSRDRRSKIIFDISIEIYLPYSLTPSILWIWECKDYSHSVPINDLEEFHAKLQQIGADKTKGTVITRGFFQKGAVEFATSKGIGLARLLPDARISHIAFSRGFEIIQWEHLPENFANYIMTESEYRPYQHFYALTTSGIIYPNDLIEYIRDEVKWMWIKARVQRMISRWRRRNLIRKFFWLPPKPFSAESKEPKGKG